MILGVDHIALSCEDVQEGSKRLEEAGYRTRFAQKDVPNRAVKQPFLRVYQSLHSVAYCEASQSVPIELTGHGAPLEDAHSPYQALLAVAPPGSLPHDGTAMKWAPIWGAALNCKRPQVSIWPAFRAQFWCDSSFSRPTESGIRAVLVPVRDAGQAEYFWRTALGFALISRGTVESGSRWTHLTFQSRFPKRSLDVILAEGKSLADNPMLDQAGFPCLALITTNIEQDTEKMWMAGVTASTGEFQVTVNDKLLRIAVFRGPDDELLELISIPRVAAVQTVEL